MSQKKYASIPNIAKSEVYPFSIGQLRHHLLNRHKNGLDKVVRKIGKRLFLRLDLFEEWIETQGKGGSK